MFGSIKYMDILQSFCCIWELEGLRTVALKNNARQVDD